MLLGEEKEAMETLCPSSAVVSSSRWAIHDEQRQSSYWTKEENKRFESALAFFDEETPYRWFKVAEMIPGKSEDDVKNKYRELVADVSDIEAGLVPIPGYLASSFTLELADHGFDLYRKKPRTCDQERKKGVPWTEEEHRRFLLGLEKHGKGDWRSISRNFVVSKTPTQVASHAQKYYLRQLSAAKDKRRPSIHDITTVHLSDASRLSGKSDDDDRHHRKNPAKIVMDWNHKNDAAAALMVFDASNFLDIAQNNNNNNSHCIFNINNNNGHASAAPAGFYIKSPRFYG